MIQLKKAEECDNSIKNKKDFKSSKKILKVNDSKSYGQYKYSMRIITSTYIKLMFYFFTKLLLIFFYMTKYHYNRFNFSTYMYTGQKLDSEKN